MNRRILLFNLINCAVLFFFVWKIKVAGEAIYYLYGLVWFAFSLIVLLILIGTGVIPPEAISGKPSWLLAAPLIVFAVLKMMHWVNW